MKELIPNEFGLEDTHMPITKIDEEDKKLHVTVNHEMDEEHYIEWICIEDGDVQKFTYFTPGDKIDVTCCHASGVKVYAYCSKHGLWLKEL